MTEQKKRERKVDINGDRHEQVFLVQTINALEKTWQWESMAIVIAFDDSDGDYDHQMSPIFNGSYRATRSAKRDGYFADQATLRSATAKRCGEPFMQLQTGVRNGVQRLARRVRRSLTPSRE